MDICLIQETHSTQDIEKKWETEWGGNIFYSNNNSSSQGVMIMCKKDIEVVECRSDVKGRSVTIKIRLTNSEITLMNIYAPNTEKEQVIFYDDIRKNILTNYDVDNLIIGGDFNIHLEEIDKRGGKDITKTKSRPSLKNLINQCKVVDVWRMRNPDKICFTWKQNEPSVMSRLDYFLVSKPILD